MSKARYITYNGETHRIKEWAKILDMGYNILSSKLRYYGYSMERVIAANNRQLISFEIDGTVYTYKEIEEKYGVPESTVRGRLKRGYTIAEAVSYPPDPSHIRTKHSPHRKRRAVSAYDDVYVVGCSRFDCLYQDGSGVCKLKLKEKTCNGEFYKDAYEYYYGGEYVKEVHEAKVRNNSGGKKPAKRKQVEWHGKNEDVAEQHAKEGELADDGTDQEKTRKLYEAYTGSGSVYLPDRSDEIHQKFWDKEKKSYEKDRELLLNGFHSD